MCIRPLWANFRRSAAGNQSKWWRLLTNTHTRTHVSDTTVADAWKRSRGDVKDAMLFGVLGYARVVRGQLETVCINRCGIARDRTGQEIHVRERRGVKRRNDKALISYCNCTATVTGAHRLARNFDD
jgi:hypothetical protein